MPPAARTTNTTSADIGYDVELWQTADALRGCMDVAMFKHVSRARDEPRLTELHV